MLHLEGFQAYDVTISENENLDKIRYMGFGIKKINKMDKKKKEYKPYCPLFSIARGKATHCLEEKCSFWYEGLIITDCAIVCIAQALGSIGLERWHSV